ncbi:MAG TPA: hypothetical protein VHD85_10040 [Terracidiphilus sp.]|nr:hypothetical protein [Terracidiphilus sp.]
MRGFRRGEHLLWGCEPVFNHQLVAISIAGSLEAFIAEQELDDIAAARPCGTCELLNIALRQWTDPAPLAAQGLAQARFDCICAGFCSEDGTGKCVEQRRVGIFVRQRSAPTSRALRDQLCAAAQVRVTRCIDELFTFPWGGPREAEAEPRGSGTVRAWSTPPPARSS